MKPITIICLILGIIFLTVGVVSSQSATESVFEQVKGRYTWNTMYYLLGGIGLIAAAGFQFLGRKE